LAQFSWANFSLLSLCSHRNARAGLHLLGRPNTLLARGQLQDLAVDEWDRPAAAESNENNEETVAARILRNRMASQPELGLARDAEVQRCEIPGTCKSLRNAGQ
jgi:hypothetical protein